MKHNINTPPTATNWYAQENQSMLTEDFPSKYKHDIILSLFLSIGEHFNEKKLNSFKHLLFCGRVQEEDHRLRLKK